MDSNLKNRLATGQLSIGSWIQLGHPGIAEILADAGFAWIAVDCEHGSIGIETLTDVFRGMHGRGAAPFARVTENATMPIRRALDAGAAGVFVPLVNTAANAERAVAAARFPPAGRRGFAFTRANAHGTQFHEYAQAANDSVVVIVMIESREAVENVDSIVAVDGVDGVFIGPYDLSGSYDIPGQLNDPAIVSATARVVTAARAAGKAAGIHLVRPSRESIRQAVSDGYTLLALGMDTVFLSESAAEVLGALDGR